MNESQALDALSALSQETRLRIVRYLVQCGSDGAFAGDVGEALGAASSRLSFHLAALEHAGLVSSERISRHIRYRAEFPQLGAVIAYLLHDCCDGHPDIAACCQ